MEKMDRRKYPRVKTNSLIWITAKGQTGNFTPQGMGKALNLSRRGLLVESSCRISSKTVSLVSVDLANNLTGIRGEVIWSREVSTGKVHSGLRLLGSELEIINFCKALIKVSCRRENAFSEVAEAV